MIGKTIALGLIATAVGIGAVASTPEADATTASKTLRVPNVVGMNHQYAQDTMQARGFYSLREVDATGRGRMLLWDRNWKVVRQTPKPGTRASEWATITLYSVKYGERP
jgi:beta-lactam-binding protein with PASTA domain